MKIESAFDIIRAEIDKIPGYKKPKGDGIFVRCPFHDEKTPSCSVNLDDNARVRIGSFHCFGCGEKGNWNKLAEKFGLAQIAEWQHFKGSTDGALQKVNQQVKNLTSLTNQTLQRLFDEVGNSVIPWPKTQDWRSYSGKLIHRVEGYMYDDKRYDEIMLVLPVYINGRFRGGVRALQEKPKVGPSYINLGGNWTLDYGLLGYDFIRKYDLFGYKSVVLVEGPRDWLRLIKNKIPACAILGSKMFSEKKLILLMGLGIEKIFSFPDNDSSGRGMAKLIGEVCGNLIEHEYLELPRKRDDKGNLIKLDPDNCSQKIIDKVKGMLV